MILVVCNKCGKHLWDGMTQEEIIKNIYVAQHVECSDCLLDKIISERENKENED